MAIGFMKRMSPQYVLEKAIEDIKKTGIDGLKPYLTYEGRNQFEKARKASGGMDMLSGGMDMFSGGMDILTGGMDIFSGGIGMFMGQADQGNNSGKALSFLMENASACDWKIIDVLKGSESSKGVVGFEYKDILEGTLELSMIHENKEWKIDNFNMPNFNKFKMPEDKD